MLERLKPWYMREVSYRGFDAVIQRFCGIEEDIFLGGVINEGYEKWLLFHGKSFDDAEEAFKNLIDDYIQKLEILLYGKSTGNND